MRQAVRGLDHAVIMVEGIDDAERAYRRLGFQVRPRGINKALGMANHLMIFERDYVEISGIIENTEFNADRRKWLKATGGGLANIALATDGADIAYQAFKEAGLSPDLPLPFERAVEVAGRPEQAAFRIVRVPKTHMPIVGFFVCEHLTPQFVYRPEWAKHPNGARGIAGVTVVAAQPAHWRTELVRYFGAAAISEDDEGLVVKTGTQPVRYVTGNQYASRYPGLSPVREADYPALLSICVDDIAVCHAVLQANGVRLVKPDPKRRLVPLGEASNLALEFTEN